MMLQTEKNPQRDESLWQAWTQNNEAQDEVRFGTRVRVIGLVLVFLVVSVLLWKFTE